MKFGKSFLTAGILAAGLCFTAEAAVFDTAVKTADGTVIGSYDDKHQAVEWLGVPYAQQAQGKLRWTAAKKVKHYKELDCSKTAAANIQYNGKQVLGEEGVLTLDIVRPDSDNKKLPVMVYFHGGNNQTSNSRLMQGNKLAQEADIVYVSVQYRLGLLGFNNLPAISDKEGGNFGFADQSAALEWVKKNIARFGGDPDNITVSGFSAGGRDVLAMLISPKFDGKFNKAISFSGGLTVADNAKSQQVLAKKLAPLAVEDGMAADVITAENWLLSEKGKDKKAVRNYLQNVKAERLAPVMAGAVIRMSAFPHLYGDDKMLPAKGFATKHYNSVPLLLLASSDEFTSFAARDPFFKNRLDQINKDVETTKEFRFANKYGSKLYGFFNGQESAEVLYPHYKKDIYVCTFNFGHNSDVVGEQFTSRYGALHGVFMPFLSDQGYGFAKQNDAFEQPGPQELSKIFIASLSAFMRTGNPNTTLLETTWNKWNPQYRPELVFDANMLNARVSTVNSRVSYNGILAEMENDASISGESKQQIMHHVLNGRWFSDRLDEKYGNEDLWVK